MFHYSRDEVELLFLLLLYFNMSQSLIFIHFDTILKRKRDLSIKEIFSFLLDIKY